MAGFLKPAAIHYSGRRIIRLIPATVLALVAIGWSGAGQGADFAPPDKGSIDRPLERIQQAFESGDFQEFARAAASEAALQPADRNLLLAESEALLALGRPHDAETAAARAWHAAAPTGDSFLSGQRATRLWLISRLRQAKTLEGLIAPKASGDASRLPDLLQYWRRELAGEATYRVVSPVHSSTADRDLDELVSTTSPNRLSVDINGIPLQDVTVDTGAQYTMLTPEAARGVKLVPGPASTELVGFGRFPARPALVKTLQIGRITLENVPVLVGDAPALRGSAVQAALGIDVMHHVRFTLDYPQRKIYASLASRRGSPRVPAETSKNAVELWTFSQACLAQARLPQGEFARVLIDTGNRRGAFVSTRWTARALSNNRPSAHLVRFARSVSMPPLTLGQRSMPRWPAARRLPVAMEQLNLFDVLAGEQMLSGSAVTIDLPGRKLEFRDSRPATFSASQVSANR